MTLSRPPAGKFSVILGDARRKAGLSQEELAFLTEIPIRTLQAYESARRKPGRKHIVQLSRVLKISLDMLLSNE